ncbi:UbiA family prenyltransferase [Bosea sp. (in: a-proteobacteria)]|uniref:UbiA family prenyltransferase n=1 Tax=Bosea sp. (in: a-proteobacteria) TaxID=1871050 RepID=UPI002FC58BDA
MDARTETRHIPLCVDLDGTLLAADTLWEGAAIILLRNPLMLFPMLFWLAKGKARLKHEVALRSGRKAQDWPYRQAVIDRLAEERKAGRELVLVTGAAPSVARDVADHVGLFSSVMHSTDALNLTSSRKRQALVDRFGDGAFDYMGNSRDDIAVFEVARRAIVVAPDAAAEKWRRNHDAERLETGKVSALAPLKSIRVHQWAKNVLIGVPMILNHEVLHFDAIMSVIVAFFAFSFLASAVYVINDLSDLANDRRHAKKRHRPLASGQMSVPTALILAGCLVLASLSLTLLLPWKFAGVLAFYACATTAYTFVLKRKLLVDVFTLAGLYTTRIVAGAAATGTELSFWLVSFAIFFFLSLALVKRYAELRITQDQSGLKKAGRGYHAEDIEALSQLGMASGCTCALIMALYVDSAAVKELYRYPQLIWLICPIVLYQMSRVWFLARRGQMPDDPLVFMIRDWRSQLTGALVVVIMVAATVIP